MKKFIIFISIFMVSNSVIAQTYTFGVVPQQTALNIYKNWQPLITHIRDATGLDIKLETARSLPAFEKKLHQGRYDFVYMNPYHYIQVNKSLGYLPFARDTAEIRGVLVANHAVDKSIIKDGEVFLFPSPHAFGATLLVKYELNRKYGADFFKSKNIIYVNSHDSVYKGIARKFGDVGGGVFRTYDNFHSKDEKSKLKIMHITKGYPGHPIAHKDSISKADQQKVLMAILSAPPEILEGLSMNKFIQTNDADYDVIRNLVKDFTVN